MKFFGYIISAGLSREGTCWWHNIDTETSCREDHLVSLTRIYSRRDRAYMHRLILGRLNLGWAKIRQ